MKALDSKMKAPIDARTILITGGSSGIGAATVELLRERGYRTISVSRRPSSPPDTASSIACDVTDSAALQRLPNQLRSRGVQSLDGLFIAAGGGGFQTLSDADPSSIEACLALNLQAAMLTLRALRPMLGNPASVVFCGSAIANLGIPTSGMYAASKAAIESLTISLAGELGPQIRVNCVTPGAIRTPLYSALGLDIAEIERGVTATVPLARMGEPREVAEVVEFLVSTRSSYVSGAIIAVHGGGLSNRTN